MQNQGFALGENMDGLEDLLAQVLDEYSSTAEIEGALDEASRRKFTLSDILGADSFTKLASAAWRAF